MPAQKKRHLSNEAQDFMSACWDGRLDDVANAVAAGFDVNLQHSRPLPFAPNLQDSRLTGLMYAAIQGHTEVAQFLLSRGANLSIESKLRNTALGYAAPLGRTQIVEALLSRGANANDTVTAGFGVFSVLHQACHNAHLDTVRALIQHGADLNGPARFGNPLQAAADNASLEIVRELLGAGADPNPSRRKPLITAAARGHDKIVRLLLSAGAELNCTDTWGMTPLMWAARNGRAGTVKLLLARKADTNTLSSQLSQGRLTALGFAEREGHSEVVRLLKDAGASLGSEPPKPYKLRMRTP